MSHKIGINGCGRIGKLLIRMLSRCPEFELVVINDPMPSETLLHLLRFDTLHGRFEATAGDRPDSIVIDDQIVDILHESLPENIPWGTYGVDCVLEASGKFRTTTKLKQHLASGAKKVILCQPSLDEIQNTIVMGVNDHLVRRSDTILSNASCTTNCIAPLLKVLHEKYEVKRAFFNTVHPYTSNQTLHDGPHIDPRRSRAALGNIIPTTSTAVEALNKVLPSLSGRIDGFATRVPVPLGSYVEITAQLKHSTSVESINAAFKEAAEHKMKGIIEYCTDPVVSSDIIGNSHSAVFDALCTKVIGGDFIQVLAWYDNETAYSQRVIDLLRALYSK